jgi:hypothetical protein
MTEPGDDLERYVGAFSRELGRAARSARRPRTWRRVADALRRPLTGRTLTVAIATIVVAGSASAAVVRFAAAPPSYDGAAEYARHGNAHDCIDFRSQAFAQAVLRANPADPNALDPDRDGVACVWLPGPKDLRPVAAIVDDFHCRPTDQRSARCPGASQPFSPFYYVKNSPADVYDCKQLASQADAQAVLRAEPSDPNDLDGDHDGIACPSLPAPKDFTPVPVRRGS